MYQFSFARMPVQAAGAKGDYMFLVDAGSSVEISFFQNLAVKITTQLVLTSGINACVRSYTHVTSIINACVKKTLTSDIDEFL